MIYKIEQYDNDNNVWFEVGESISSACAMQVINELKKENKNLFFRLVCVIDIF